MRRFLLLLLFLMALLVVIHLLRPIWIMKYSPPMVGQFYMKMFHKNEQENVLILYGNVDIRQVDLGFRVFGRIKFMFFEEGDFVPAGALMAVLDKQPYEDQLRESIAHMESLEASLKDAQKLVARRQLLVGTGGISPQEVDDAISSRNSYQANLNEARAAVGVSITNLNDTELYAPADGTILTRIREPGAVVKQADPIYTLSLTSPIWIRTYVSEIQLGLIYPGMLGKVYTDTPGGNIYTGHIGFISPVAEFTPKTVETTQLRTDLVYRLRVIADNPDRGLRQGMPVTVKFLLSPPPTSTNLDNLSMPSKNGEP